MSLYVDTRPTHPLLGRHVCHDTRSLDYLFPRTVTQFYPVKWEPKIPVLDQRNVGACTGFATVTCLGHAPYRETISATILDSIAATKVYSEATRLDSHPGTYPPTDTGSDGLSAAKAAKQFGLISGYLHITTPAALASALAVGPVIVGTDWYESMFRPDSMGRLTVDPASGVAGGHEYTLDEVTEHGEFGFTNSWGASWGAAGRFYMAQVDFLRLLADKGDATHFVPVTQPAPAPTPQPKPAPDSSTLIAYRALQAWAKENDVK